MTEITASLSRAANQRAPVKINKQAEVERIVFTLASVSSLKQQSVCIRTNKTNKPSFCTVKIKGKHYIIPVNCNFIVETSA